MRKPEQFAALVGDRAPWRTARQWIAMAARVAEGAGEGQGNGGQDSGVRFGFTVGRRQARRAVQRVMVKRVLREAARSAGPGLRELARGRNLDVVLRLRSPLPDPAKMTLIAVKRALRRDAEALIAQLGQYLRGALR